MVSFESLGSYNEASIIERYRKLSNCAPSFQPHTTVARGGHGHVPVTYVFYFIERFTSFYILASCTNMRTLSLTSKHIMNYEAQSQYTQRVSHVTVAHNVCMYMLHQVKCNDTIPVFL